MIQLMRKINKNFSKQKIRIIIKAVCTDPVQRYRVPTAKDGVAHSVPSNKEGRTLQPGPQQFEKMHDCTTPIHLHFYPMVYARIL